MQMIKEISDRIEEELEDSETYIKYALKYKQHDESLAEVYYRLSLQETDHAKVLHEESARLIQEYKEQGNTIPVAMQAVYDHLHEKHIEKSNEVKMLQEQYR